jgi:hypothetical protein
MAHIPAKGYERNVQRVPEVWRDHLLNSVFVVPCRTPSVNQTQPLEDAIAMDINRKDLPSQAVHQNTSGTLLPNAWETLEILLCFHCGHGPESRESGFPKPGLQGDYEGLQLPRPHPSKARCVNGLSDSREGKGFEILPLYTGRFQSPER